MKRTLPIFFAIAICLSAGAILLPATASAETYSNRHHLSGCTDQSVPVVIPYATHRTVQLGLPADIRGDVQITELYGFDEETRLRLRPRGLVLNTEGGGARMIVHPRSNC